MEKGRYSRARVTIDRRSVICRPRPSHVVEPKMEIRLDLSGSEEGGEIEDEDQENILRLSETVGIG